MRISPSFIAFAVFAATSVAASAQEQAAAPSAGKTPAGISLAYDAPRGQFTASGFVLKPAVKSEAAAAFTGTADVTVSVKLVSKYAAGTTFPCSVIVLGGNIDITTLSIEGGYQTVNSTAKVTTVKGVSTATCTVSVPYEWTLSSGAGSTSGLLIAYAVAEVTAGVTERSALQLGAMESLPANGATDTFTFDAVL